MDKRESSLILSLDKREDPAKIDELVIILNKFLSIFLLINLFSRD